MIYKSSQFRFWLFNIRKFNEINYFVAPSYPKQDNLAQPSQEFAFVLWCFMLSKDSFQFTDGLINVTLARISLEYTGRHLIFSA